MVNAWSLAWEALNGTMDEEYPIIDTKIGAGNTAYDFDGLDYEIDYYTDSADYMAEIDDMYSHHFNTEQPMAHYFKYHEEEILKDIQEYVSGTYQGHYTGNSHEFRKVQTIDPVSYTHLTLPTN